MLDNIWHQTSNRCQTEHSDVIIFCNLGIYIGHDSEKCFKLNWLSKIEQVGSVLKKWAKRKISLFGKIEVIKRFALSKIVVPASILESNTMIEKKLSTLFHNFIWGEKIE